jgi:arylsulfatase A-like enzyme
MVRHTASTMAVAVALAAGCADAPAVPQRIVVITLDTLRLDSLETMPELAAWSREAAVFERYYSATSTTQPTHATLFTGLPPWRHGVPFNGALLAERHETLAERLAASGWATAAAVASFPVHSKFGFAQGFADYREDFTQRGVREWSGVKVDGRAFHSEAAAVVAAAVAQVDAARAHGAERQFFWFHFFDPHAPYGAESGDRGRHYNPLRVLAEIEAGDTPEEACRQARALYDADVRYLDQQLAQLLAHLDVDAGEVETHGVILSDHGESFGERGALGHGRSLAPEQIHVPLIVRSPRLAPGRVNVAVGTVDVAATLLALAGLDAPEGGRDLTLPLAPAPVSGMRRTFNETCRDERTDGSARVIEPEDRRFFVVEDGMVYTGDSQAVGLDDVDAPLGDSEREARLRALFAGFERDFAAAESERDAVTVEALKELGYAE